MSSVLAVSAAMAQDGNQLVSVRVAPSVGEIHPGERFFLAFTFDIADEWHIYWANPGDSGTATEITITAPEGFKAGSTIWTRPTRIPGATTTFGYEKQAILFVPILAPKELNEGTVEFACNVDWLVCKTTCLLGSAQPKVSVHTTSASAPESVDEADANESDVSKPARGAANRGKPFDDAELAAIYRNRVPAKLARLKKASMTFADGKAVLSGPARGLTEIDVFPNPTPGVTLTVIEASITDDSFHVVLEVVLDEANTLGERPFARGIIALGEGPADQSYEFDLPLRETKRKKDQKG